jgi:hypothetical protein
MPRAMIGIPLPPSAMKTLPETPKRAVGRAVVVDGRYQGAWWRTLCLVVSAVRLKIDDV